MNVALIAILRRDIGACRSYAVRVLRVHVVQKIKASGPRLGSASMQSSEKLRLNSFSAQCLWTRARKPPVRDWLQLSISFPSSSSSAPRSGSSTYTRQPLKGKGRASQRTIRFRGDAVCLCPAVAGGVAGAIVGTIVVTKFPCVRLAFREQHGNADDYCRPSHFTPP
jgi:hypothetical protein